jgi:hypothetical protein
MPPRLAENFRSMATHVQIAAFWWCAAHIPHRRCIARVARWEQASARMQGAYRQSAASTGHSPRGRLCGPLRSLKTAFWRCAVSRVRHRCYGRTWPRRRHTTRARRYVRNPARVDRCNAVKVSLAAFASIIPSPPSRFPTGHLAARHSAMMRKSTAGDAGRHYDG